MSDPEIVVLADSVRAADVRAHAQAHGWTLVGDTPRAHLGMASRRYRTAHGTEVLEIEDHTASARSLRITGPRASATRTEIEAALAHVSESELLVAAASDDPLVCIRVAGKLAVVRPRALDPRHLAALQRLITHPETAVRRAGIRSAYGCRWPELRRWLGARMQAETRLRDAMMGLVAWIDEG